MTQSLPSWFAADQVFNDRDGWYIGSPTGFRVGPYQRRAQAEHLSQGLLFALSRCKSTGDRVTAIRAFLHEQNHGKEDDSEAASAPNRPPAAGKTPAEPPITGRLNLPPVRSGEEPRTWFRTNRVFAVDDVWFFATRENIDVGPYATRAEAERDAKRLTEILSATASDAESRLAIQQFKTRPRAGYFPQ